MLLIKLSHRPGLDFFSCFGLSDTHGFNDLHLLSHASCCLDTYHENVRCLIALVQLNGLFRGLSALIFKRKCPMAAALVNACPAESGLCIEICLDVTALLLRKQKGNARPPFSTRPWRLHTLSTQAHVTAFGRMPSHFVFSKHSSACWKDHPVPCNQYKPRNKIPKWQPFEIAPYLAYTSTLA